MKKFSTLNENVEQYDPEQLKMGLEIEKEHGDIYEELLSYLNSEGVTMPWTKEMFYVQIAKAHLREMPDYYTKLKKMESEN